MRGDAVTPPTIAEIAEARRFAGDANRPHDRPMARIAAEQIVMHLETTGFAPVAMDREARR